MMLKPNVQLDLYENGKLIDGRTGHNAWTNHGRAWLAHVISLSSVDPDVAESPYRVRYMGFGIGGVRQPVGGVADVVPFSVSYPAGFDTNATTGHSYNKDFVIVPDILTLERPVRVTGSALAYPGVFGDVWLVDTPHLFFTHTSAYDLVVHAILDGTAGDVAYAPFTHVPLSEVALFSDEPAVDPLVPFSALLTYFSFDPLVLTATRVLEVSWTISFP